MPLTVGTQLGPYEIVGPLGVGGMGEVYRARDTKLGREVALKVLPAAFASDPERMARFRREAQVLASLNHPNIAAVYGLEDGTLPTDKPVEVHLDINSSSRAPVIVSGEPPALVMELVEGPTLSERLRQRRIELEDSLPIARQIAEGLEAAHDRGIIHRDLKPANIKIRPDAVVKILDFGLAKAIQGDPSSTDLQNSPTISYMSTMAGVILGTAAYMSPEQAKGKPLDRRTDVWSFGCVLFEMLSGKQAFVGETSSDILADVIRGEPRWQELPESTPPRLNELLRRCLQKDPKQRLQAIGEARIAVEQTLAEITVAANSPDGTISPVASGLHPQATAAASASNISSPAFAPPAAPPRVTNSSNILPWVLAAIFAGLAAWLGFTEITQLKHPASAIVTQLLPPDGETFALTGNYAGPPQLSPDGHYLAFVGTDKAGVHRLWIRPLSDAKPQLIANSDGVTEPFWSPDSRSVGYFSAGKMYRVEVNGGSPRAVTDAINGRGGSWSPNGTILYAPNTALGLRTVADSGGTGQPLGNPDPDSHIPNRRWPQILPDGQHFICFARADVAAESGVFAGSLDGSAPKLILHNDSNAIYAAPGYLIFVQGGVLMAQKFDTRTLSVSGQALPLAQHAEVNAIIYRSIVTAADNGLLIYGTGSGAQGSYTMHWTDRTGKVLGAVGESAEYSDPRISHDGTKLAVTIDTGEGGNNIWVYDLVHGTRNRVTFGNGITSGPTWSPDDKTLIFSSGAHGLYQLYQQPADGSGQARPLTSSNNLEVNAFWSADGKYVSYTVPNTGSSFSQIWLLPLAAGGKGVPFVQGNYDVLSAAISPNSKWLAYTSNETGHHEIYVVPLAGGPGKWQVSSAGGFEPRWSAKGDEISYISPDGDLMLASVKPANNSLIIGNVTKLFHVGQTSAYSIFRYDFAPDGKRFLVMNNETPAQSEPLTVISNWQALLPK